MQRKIGDIVSNIVVHSTLTLQLIDDLEPHNTVFRHKFKNIAKSFRKETEEILNNMHNNMSKEDALAMLACYDDYFKMLGMIDKLTIVQRHELRGKLEGIINELG